VETALPERQDSPFPGTVAEARLLQERLRGEVRIRPLDVSRLRSVAAADVTFLEEKETVAAAVVVVDCLSGEVAEEVTAVVRTGFPYVPGYLSFREGPAILAAWGKLRRPPDAVLFDGQGIAHPRRFGIASHIGVLLDVPSVGCAKSRLVGVHDEPGGERGEWEPLRHEGEVVGAALRTRRGVKPVYVSAGHRADLPTAIALVLSLCTRFRLPDPARRAHQLTREMRAGGGHSSP
jgi:deoxyribonuclease V